MCGLFGFSGKQSVDLTKLRWLAVENQSRGSHSAGIYTIKHDKNKTRTIFKETGLSSVLINDPLWRDAVVGAKTVQGHTRAATFGAITKDNAHPFAYDFEGGTLVVGAHNGFVLPTFKGEDQWKRFGFDKEFTVDSQLIFAALAKTGDYNILPQIEGGIACSFQMPNKYGDALFLYQASGRELHFGLAPEGVYYSSEREPLKFIDAKVITAVPYHSMVVLQEGVVLDLLPMPKPTIVLRPNAKRDSWNESTSLTVDELRKLGYEELAEKESKKSSYYNGYNSYPAKKHTGQSSNLPSSINTKDDGMDMATGQTEYQDKLQLLINDVKDLINGLIPEPVQFLSASSYSNNDTSSCIVLIKVLSSTKMKQPLPGWLVYDNANQSIGGITALNGVTAIKYPQGECDKKHTLVLSCPVEEKNTPTIFSIDVDPIASRVMEVTLELPFPSRDNNETESVKGKVEVDDLPFKIVVGRSQLSICASRSEQRASVLSIAGEDAQELSDESLHSRSEEQQALEQQECKGGNNGDASGSCGVYQEEHIRPGSGCGSRVGKTFVMLPVGNIATLKAVLDDENKTFRHKDRVKKVLLSQEYSFAMAMWARNFQSGYFDLRRLFHDAAVLKLNDLDKFSNSYALSYYAWRLATHLTDNYLMRRVTEDDNKHIFRALGNIARSNREIHQDAQEVAEEKKLELARIDLIT